MSRIDQRAIHAAMTAAFCLKPLTARGNPSWEGEVYFTGTAPGKLTHIIFESDQLRKAAEQAVGKGIPGTQPLCVSTELVMNSTGGPVDGSVIQMTYGTTDSPEGRALFEEWTNDPSKRPPIVELRNLLTQAGSQAIAVFSDQDHPEFFAALKDAGLHLDGIFSNGLKMLVSAGEFPDQARALIATVSGQSSGMSRPFYLNNTTLNHPRSYLLVPQDDPNAIVLDLGDQLVAHIRPQLGHPENAAFVTALNIWDRSGETNAPGGRNQTLWNHQSKARRQFQTLADIIAAMYPITSANLG